VEITSPRSSIRKCFRSRHHRRGYSRDFGIAAEGDASIYRGIDIVLEGRVVVIDEVLT